MGMLPQDVSTFVPRVLSDIDVILVCNEGAWESHKGKVRRSKILMALEWLRGTLV